MRVNALDGAVVADGDYDVATGLVQVAAGAAADFLVYIADKIAAAADAGVHALC